MPSCFLAWSTGVTCNDLGFCSCSVSEVVRVMQRLVRVRLAREPCTDVGRLAQESL